MLSRCAVVMIGVLHERQHEVLGLGEQLKAVARN